MLNFKPMKGVSVEIESLRFPLYVSRKLDGLRGVVIDGKLCFSSCKDVPNKATRDFFSHPALNGLDGELIVGAPNAKDVFKRSTGALRKFAFDPKAVFYVFDVVPQILGVTDRGFAVRHEALCAHVSKLVAAYPKFAGRIVVLEQRLVANADALTAMEAEVLADGYEGLIVRSLSGPYKMGRATADEGWCGKIKRFVDGEARVLGLIDGNGSWAGTTGALLVRDLVTGAEFSIGSLGRPFDASIIGGIVKYKWFPIGYDMVPRHPILIGERLAADMTA